MPYHCKATQILKAMSSKGLTALGAIACEDTCWGINFIYNLFTNSAIRDKEKFTTPGVPLK